MESARIRDRRRRLGHVRNLPRKKWTQTQTSTPLHPLLLDRFSRTMRAIAARMPVDYGVPPPGCIRFFTVPIVPATAATPWFIQTIISHDRTLREWVALIKEWKASPLPEKYDTPLESGNPFTTRRAAAAFLTDLLARELRLRWLARKFVARIRERIYTRRIVGQECDLFTTEPVPAYARVCVRDRTTRSLYCFHVRTATHLITSALAYSNYGIAAPQAPKNPYTNRPWSLVQLMAMTAQICAHTFHSGRHIPPLVIQKFRRCGHSVEAYFNKYTNELLVAGARNYFKDVRNPELLETCGDLLDDLYEVIGWDICVGWRVVKTYVLGRLLPRAFQDRWDKVLLAIWIHTNFGRCVGFRTQSGMMTEFADLHEESYSWWVAQPKTILRREAAEDSGSDSD
jgi:hypothetical protein